MRKKKKIFILSVIKVKVKSIQSFFDRFHLNVVATIYLNFCCAQEGLLFTVMLYTADVF